jgi:hypothetical protein
LLQPTEKDQAGLMVYFITDLQFLSLLKAQYIVFDNQCSPGLIKGIRLSTIALGVRANKTLPCGKQCSW